MTVSAIDGEESYFSPLQSIQETALKTSSLETFSPLFFHRKSCTSTLASVSDKSTPAIPSRPILEKPKNAISNLIDFQIDLEKTTGKIIDTTGEELRHLQQEIRKIEEERTSLLEEEAKNIQSRNTWSTLAHVAGYVLNVASIMTGSHLLIASGVIGLMTRAGHDTHFFSAASRWASQSEETQQKIMKAIDGLSVALQVSLSLSGLVIAYNGGALSGITGIESLKKASSVLSMSAGATAAVSHIGMSIYQNKIAKLRSQVRQMDGDVAMKNQHDLPKKTRQMVESTEFTGQEAREIRKAIDSLYG